MDLNNYSKKKVFITGYTGFKGSWLCKLLEVLGAEVGGYSLPLECKDHLSYLNVNGDFVSGDIRDLDKLKLSIKRFQPDLVIHLAAQSLVRDSYFDPLATFDINVIGTGKVLEACRSVDSIKGIICITTDKCYENKEWLWGYRENEPMGGHDPYSASKACAELLISSYRRSFFPLNEYGVKHQTLVASARAGNVIGGGDWSKDRLIPDIIRATIDTQKVVIRSPKSVRPWQHVLDCLYGYLLLGIKLMAGEKIYADAWNFGPSDKDIRTVEEVLVMAQRHWNNIDFTIDGAQAHLHEARLLKLDSSKANDLLCWKPLWNCEMSIKKTILWYKSFYEQKLNTESDILSYLKGVESQGMKSLK